MDRPDDELVELLAAADGERLLPGDLEDRLLRDILDTAAQSRSSSGPPAEKSAIGTLVTDPETSVGSSRRHTPLLVAAAACIVLLVGGLLAVGRNGPTPPVAEQPPVPTAAAFDPADLNDEAACDALGSAIEGAGLVGPSVVVSELEPDELRLVGVLADDLQRRRTVVDAVMLVQFDDDVLVPLDYAATQLVAGRTEAAVSAHERAVTGLSELRQRWPDEPCLAG